jgi:hypothetical protein
VLAFFLNNSGKAQEIPVPVSVAFYFPALFLKSKEKTS